MKTFAFVILVSCIAFFEPLADASELNVASSHPFSFYGISWRGKPSDNLKYAREMGYHYVIYQHGMENDPDARGIYFYIEEPERDCLTDYPSRRYDPKRNYSPEEKSFFDKYLCWKSLDPFPANLATGWFYNDNEFDMKLDLQQQAVIDKVVDAILRKLSRLENKDLAFLFAGYAWDESNLDGSFYVKTPISGSYSPVNLSFWNGTETCILHDGITHEYATYSDGRAAFLKQLFTKTREIYPEMKVIMEPYSVWDDWIKQIKNRPDKTEINADLITQEKYGTQFLDESRLYATGLVTKDRVGSTSPDRQGERENRILAGKTAVNGAWFNWFGRFGGSRNGDMPDYKNIYDVPARLKLVRVVPNWENLNSVPLSDRNFDGKTYHSPLSVVSSDVIYSRKPGESRIYAVFLTKVGRIRLNADEKVISIKRAGKFFEETEDAAAELKISDEVILATDSTWLEEGYIITISDSLTSN